MQTINTTETNAFESSKTDKNTPTQRKCDSTPNGTKRKKHPQQETVSKKCRLSTKCESTARNLYLKPPVSLKSSSQISKLKNCESVRVLGNKGQKSEVQIKRILEPVRKLGNKGEKSEVQIKRILELESEKESSQLLRVLFNLGPTDTVNFPTQSMKKAANKEKADCFIEVGRDQNKTIYKMSIKFVGSGDCSIVNQDHRAKSVYSPNWRNCEEGVLFHCLGGIDSLISRLNYERAIGDRSQDIPFINIDFTEVERKAMEALLVHHTFIGAGTGAFQPHVQSNCVLIVGNVQDPNTWRLTHCLTDDDKKKFIQSKWDKYILAIRGKGMQVEQSYRKSALPQHQLARWVSVWAVPRFINRVEQKGYSYPVDGCEYVGNWWEKPKCTLNIRMKK